MTIALCILAAWLIIGLVVFFILEHRMPLPNLGIAIYVVAAVMIAVIWPWTLLDGWRLCRRGRRR